jgi:hypothetical protein
LLIFHPIGLLVIVGVVLALAFALSAGVVLKFELLGITRMEWRARWIVAVGLVLSAVLFLVAWFII